MLNLVQVVDEIYDKLAASKMGIDMKGQVVVFIHSGSRGLGHQVATDSLMAMEKAIATNKIELNDRQVRSKQYHPFLLLLLVIVDIVEVAVVVEDSIV